MRNLKGKKGNMFPKGKIGTVVGKHPPKQCSDMTQKSSEERTPTKKRKWTGIPIWRIRKAPGNFKDNLGTG